MKKGIIGVLAVGLLMGCTATKEPDIEIWLQYNNTPFIEYGSEVDTSEFVAKTNADSIDYPKMSTSIVGEQTLIFEATLGKQKKAFEYTVEVKDTQKPIIEFKNRKLEIDYKGKVDIEANVQSVKDPIDGDIKYKKEADVQKDEVNYYTYHNDINTSKSGTYKVSFKAVDKNKNITEDTIEVVVKEEKKKKDVAVSSQSNASHQSSQSSNTTNSKPVNSNESTAQPEQPSKQEDTDRSLVANLKVAKSASKILIASASSYSSRKGKFQYYEKVAGKWIEKGNTSCIFGKSGLGSGSENSQKTPIGLYRFTHLMGIASNPGTLMNYHQIDDNDYWCGETYYNQFVDEDAHEHNCSKTKDEHLISYSKYYKYLAAFNYNSGNTSGKGFAYFLHVSGGAGYTGGCIGIDESNMRSMMQIIDSQTVMIVDLEKNITQY